MSNCSAALFLRQNRIFFIKQDVEEKKLTDHRVAKKIIHYKKNKFTCFNKAAVLMLLN